MSRLCATVLLASALPIASAEAAGEPGASHRDQMVMKTLPLDFRREPSWREPGDCGPVALYLLMRLSGRDVSLDEVKRAVPWDSKRGCSLADLVRGAQRLGYAAEVRFVSPEKLQQLRYPVIAHGYGTLESGTGHFTLIVNYSAH